MVVQMITVGEETGGLDSMLSKIADFYEDEVAAAVKALTSPRARHDRHRRRHSNLDAGVQGLRLGDIIARIGEMS